MVLDDDRERDYCPTCGMKSAGPGWAGCPGEHDRAGVVAEEATPV